MAAAPNSLASLEALEASIRAECAGHLRDAAKALDPAPGAPADLEAYESALRRFYARESAWRRVRNLVDDRRRSRLDDETRARLSAGLVVAPDPAAPPAPEALEARTVTVCGQTWPAPEPF